MIIGHYSFSPYLCLKWKKIHNVLQYIYEQFFNKYFKNTRWQFSLLFPKPITIKCIGCVWVIIFALTWKDYNFQITGVNVSVNCWNRFTKHRLCFALFRCKHLKGECHPVDMNSLNQAWISWQNWCQYVSI